jgi:hypothetical protein
MPQELCQCQLGTHGHEPGKCPEPAMEKDRCARPAATKPNSLAPPLAASLLVMRAKAIGRLIRLSDVHCM